MNTQNIQIGEAVELINELPSMLSYAVDQKEWIMNKAYKVVQTPTELLPFFLIKHGSIVIPCDQSNISPIRL